MTPFNSPPAGPERSSPVTSVTPQDSALAAPAGGVADGSGSRVDAPTIVFQQMSDLPPELSISDVRRYVQVVLRVVRQRWWMGALAAIALGAPLFYYVLSQPVEYVAETAVLVQSTIDTMLQGATGVQEGSENSVQNQLSVMNSGPFRVRVAKAFTPEESLVIQQPYLKPGKQPSFDFLAGLSGRLISVSRERGRALFTIAARHRDEDIALLIAGRFTDEFKRYLQEQTREIKGGAAKIMRTQADELSAEIQRLSGERREYRQKYNLITVEQNQSILTERLKRIAAALSELKLDRVRLESQLEQADQDLAKTPTPFDNPVLSAFGNLRELRVELERLRNEKAALAAQLGPKHPRMLEAERNLASQEATVANGFRVARQDLYGQLQLARASHEQMEGELKSTFNQSLELDKLSSGFQQLSESLAAKEKALSELLETIEQTSMEAERPTEALRVINTPYLAGGSPFKMIVTLGGIGVLSVVAFFGLPLALFYWSERLSSSTDIEGTFKKQVLGVLPRFRKVLEDDRPHIVRDNVALPDVEIYLGLVAQYELSSKVTHSKQLLVTSTVPGEGKSMNASNLAATFTRYGKKTVLVDCDFRRPVQQRFNRIAHDEGFLAWASRGFPLTDDLIKPGGPVGLTILPDGTSLIPSGGVDVQPGHVLVARQVAELFRRLAQAYDVVIVDSPPAGVFQDALLLARYCAETIVFVREGRAFSSQLKKVLSDLEKTTAPAVGLVLNGASLNNVHPSVGSRYGYGKYGYGKDYSANYTYKAPTPSSNWRSHKTSPRLVAGAVGKK